jgi:hypothetical protein
VPRHHAFTAPNRYERGDDGRGEGSRLLPGASALTSARSVKLTRGKVRLYARRQLKVIRDERRKMQPKKVSAKRRARRALWA